MAGWTIQGNGWTMTGTGVEPRILPGAPPPVPPAPPPVVPPPIEPVVVDASPFLFPSGGPAYQADGSDRYYTLAASEGGMYYAAEPSAGNPSLYSHTNAGIIAAGAVAPFGNPPKPMGGLRLWVPRSDGVLHPSLIRRVLATGRP